MDELLRELNPKQRRAVTTTEGPVLVLAGAGTGKTRVITVRVAFLLSRGAAPESVLAMTFTNKAAAEMRERISAMVGADRAAGLTIGTFHSFCVRVLRRYGEAVGVPRHFTICDASDQLAAIKGGLRDLRVAEATLHPLEALARISRLKNQLVGRGEFEEQCSADEEHLLAGVWRHYEGKLRRSKALDFDDLLVQTVLLLREDPQALEALRRRFHHVLVDEFQDTNAPQYEIVRRIASEHRNLCVVGDDDQSIYGWRGADVRKILGFERDFPGAAVVRLETNYRSTEPILEAANAVIRNNPKRHEKELRSALGGGSPVTFMEMRDEEDEADFVVAQILHLVRENRARLRDFVILVRTAMQPRTFESILRARKVPYVLVGSMSWFDRKEVRDVLAYLKLMVNPDDEVSLLRIVNCPPRGVGKTSIDRALAFATEQGITVNDAFRRADEVPKLPAAAARAVQDLEEMLRGCAKTAAGSGLVQAVESMLEQTGYKAEVHRCYDDPETRQLRWAGVTEILHFAESHARRSADPTLAGFLEALALNAAEEHDEEKEKDRDAVTLMTLHAAKGLEFKRVYLVGVEEGLLPHARSLAEDAVEEERRLMYVGITRAREHLTITWNAERAKYGRRQRCHASRFYYELQDEAPPDDWLPGGRPQLEQAGARTRE